MTSRSDEGPIPHIAFTDTNEVIRATQVQLGEDTEFLESSNDTGVLPSGSSVCGSQDTGPKAPILLTHKE